MSIENNKNNNGEKKKVDHRFWISIVAPFLIYIGTLFYWGGGVNARITEIELKSKPIEYHSIDMALLKQSIDNQTVCIADIKIDIGKIKRDIEKIKIEFAKNKIILPEGNNGIRNFE